MCYTRFRKNGELYVCAVLQVKNKLAVLAGTYNFSCHIFRTEITFEEVSISRAHVPCGDGSPYPFVPAVRVFILVIQNFLAKVVE